MSTLLVLAGGKATRLHGAYKPNLVVAGKRMIDWQREAAKCDNVVIVHHERDAFPEADALMVRTQYVTKSGGPAQGLMHALSYLDDDPVIVALADTWWTHTPSGTNWVGVCPAEGGRVWDYPNGDTYTRAFVPNHHQLPVCIGLYSFGDVFALTSAVYEAMATRTEDREVSMAEVLHFYEPALSNVEVPEWRDVGDTVAYKATNAELREILP